MKLMMKTTLVLATLALAASPALAQKKPVPLQGVSANEITLGSSRTCPARWPALASRPAWA